MFLTPIMVIIYGAAALIDAVFLLFAPQSILGVLLALLVGGVATSCVSIRLCRIPERVWMVRWIVVGFLHLIVDVALYAYGPARPGAAAYFIVLLISLYVMSGWATAMLTAAALAVFYAISIAAEVGLYRPPLQLSGALSIAQDSATWTFSLVIVACLAVSLSHRNARITHIALEQAARAQHALAALDARHQTGVRIGQTLRQNAATTVAATQQQKSGTLEQAAAVTQMLTALTELSQTAHHIARTAQRTRAISADTLTSASRVRVSAEHVAERSAAGQQKVAEVIASIEVVHDNNAALVAQLLVLSEHSHRISVMVGAITAIAAETRLLSLNAAIESAATAQSGGRFNVIASEIKKLSDRSRDTAKDVQRIVTDVQSAIAGAVRMAEQGNTTIADAVALTHSTGAVIQALGTVIEDARANAHTIVGAAQDVDGVTAEIVLATQQQQSANEQIVVTLHGVNAVAQQIAAGVTQIASATTDLETLSEQLIGSISQDVTVGVMPVTAPPVR